MSTGDCEQESYN